jgi:hypothetical protein
MKESFDHSKSIKLIAKLSERINAQFRSPGTTKLSLEALKTLADLRDFYLYEALDATQETAPEWVGWMANSPVATSVSVLPHRSCRRIRKTRRDESVCKIISVRWYPNAFVPQIR